MEGEPILDRTAVQRRGDFTLFSGEIRACLKVLSGCDAGRLFALSTGATVVGRSDEADLILHETSVSRRQFEILCLPGGLVTVADCGSTNGTYLNGERISGVPRPLAEGDRIGIGAEILLKFSLMDRMEQRANRQIYEAAVRDSLTGLYNKRYWTERFEQDFAHALRLSRPLSVAIFDLDNFKHINDVHGHVLGDQVLTCVAEQLDSVRRSGEIVARYGGDEFVLLLRDAGLEEARGAVERVRAVIADTPLPAGVPRVTCSVGLANLCEATPRPLDLFVAADRALYRAKREGRDRIAT